MARRIVNDSDFIGMSIERILFGSILNAQSFSFTDFETLYNDSDLDTAKVILYLSDYKEMIATIEENPDKFDKNVVKEVKVLPSKKEMVDGEEVERDIVEVTFSEKLKYSSIMAQMYKGLKFKRVLQYLEMMDYSIAIIPKDHDVLVVKSNANGKTHLPKTINEKPVAVARNTNSQNVYLFATPCPPNEIRSRGTDIKVEPINVNNSNDFVQEKGNVFVNNYYRRRSKSPVPNRGIDPIFKVANPLENEEKSTDKKKKGEA